MYGWIWRHLPGSTAARALEAVLLLVAVTALLLLVVFPWVEPWLPFNDVTTTTAAPRTGTQTGSTYSEPW